MTPEFTAPWTVAIYPGSSGNSVELVPKMAPDPRFALPPARRAMNRSHPPAGCLSARLGGRNEK